MTKEQRAALIYAEDLQREALGVLSALIAASSGAHADALGAVQTLVHVSRGMVATALGREWK